MIVHYCDICMHKLDAPDQGHWVLGERCGFDKDDGMPILKTLELCSVCQAALAEFIRKEKDDARNISVRSGEQE